MPFPSIEHQYRPGVSGNPNGRPRDTVTPLLREALARAGDDGKTAAEHVAEVLLREALGGNLKALGMVLDRTEGRPAVSVAVGVTTPKLTLEQGRALVRERHRERTPATPRE